MKKRKLFKPIAFLLSAVFIANMSAQTVLGVASELYDGLSASIDTEQSETVQAPTSLDQISVPNVTTNPNKLVDNGFILPVYTSAVYKDMTITSNTACLFSSYGSFFTRTAERSQYYTISPLVLEDYATLGSITVESSLPYTENRANMFHTELTASGEGRIYTQIEVNSDERDDIFGSEIMGKYLDPEQLEMIVSGKYLSGGGAVSVYRFMDGGNRQRYDSTITASKDGSAQIASVKVPLEGGTSLFDVTYFVHNGILTDMYSILIDDETPQIKSVKFGVETGLRGDEADLVMQLTFNEGIRFSSSGSELSEEFADAYITVRLWNETQGQYQYVRLYLDKVDGSPVVTFRGNIGLLHYCNFSVVNISSVNIPSAKSRYVSFAYFDLVDEMVLGAGKVKEYGNDYIKQDYGFRYSSRSNPMAMLSDHAGNGIDLYALRCLNCRGFRYNANSFDADKVRIFNEKTLGVAENRIDASEATASDCFVGPGRDLTVHVYLNRVLSEDVWNKIYITLNILDANGDPLKVFPTSAVKYVDNETYADGEKKGTMLKFENIPLTSDMTFDGVEGEEPLVIVTSMGTAYTGGESERPTAYPYVVAPYDKMYADFTPPVVSVRKTVDSEELVEGATEGDDKKYYKISIETVIEDVSVYSRSSGLQGSSAKISIGGGVEKDTAIRYVMSTDPQPPEDISEYIKSEVLAPNGMIDVGSFTTLNNREAMYVHILAESGGIYLNRLLVKTEATDMAGNKVENDPTPEIEYVIDEIPPTVSVTSRRATAGDNNTTITLSLGIQATDHSRIDQMLYCIAGDTLTEDEDWQVAVIDVFGNTVTSTVERKYGDGNSSDSEENRVYTENIWLKAIDTYGNESIPVKHRLELSLEKPATVVSYSGDPNSLSRNPRLLVSGPDAATLDGATAYTRVTVTPLSDDTYSYVTLVATGETDVDVLSLVGREWYRVKLGTNSYEEVVGPVTVASGAALLEGLINCYSDIKVSFENGYGDMTPVVYEAYSARANAGSYLNDLSYYTLRYASPIRESRITHNVDFGAIIDCAMPVGSTERIIQYGGTVVVDDADKGAAPYVFNQKYKGISPMRNAQIHFSISNVAESAFALLDFDYENSYAQLMRVGEDGGEDTVVATQMGLWSTGSQYFTIGNTMDNGEYYKTGAYYLRVTVLNGAGDADVYESSRIILDAETADNSGLWEYTYGSFENITGASIDKLYTDITKKAENEAFDSIGIAVAVGGETSRNRFFATYTYGVEGLTIVLSAPNSEKTYEGITVGEVEGFKIWNLASDPTAEDIARKGYEMTVDENGQRVLKSTANTHAIYTSDTIPKGISGASKLYLIKGTNTICYQVKMKNGYESPVRQFTVTVSDQTPELSVSIDGYQPSLTPSPIESIINADHVRYYIDTAFSVNGSGEVSVDLWSRYDMNLGLHDENGVITDTYVGRSTGVLEKRYTGMKVEEYADFTKNSYTARFPDSTAWCTAVFVAVDEYGGVAVVAPQLGDMDRVNVNAGVVGNAHEIDISYYSSFFDDPFDPYDWVFSWCIRYNQPTYFGEQLLSLETYLVENTSEGEIRRKDIQTDTADLRYNQFNICENDILLRDGVNDKDAYCVSVQFDYLENGDFVLMSDATVTLSGGYIGEEGVTLTFVEGDVITTDADGNETVARGQGNTVGYMYGGTVKWDDIEYKYFYVAYPPADNEHKAGETETLHYVFEYSNFYGDRYTKEGDIEVTYIEYKVNESKMSESGAILSYGFKTNDKTNENVTRTGKFTNGTYEISVPDYFGRTETYSFTVSDQSDENTAITYEKYTNTSQPVTVTLTGKYDIYVDITDYELMDVTGNGTKNVTVTIYKNTRFSYRYVTEFGEMSYIIDVNNIYETDPIVIHAYDTEEYYIAVDGTKYRYGSVTVYLSDPNFILYDRFTGEVPGFTFSPGGDRTYTFKKEDVIAVLGDETVELREDITVTLDIVLYEVPEIVFADGEDSETPNVQVRAFSKLGEAYTDAKLTMKLTNVRDTSMLTQYYGYDEFAYVGNRANMADVLDRLGWSTSYRFIVETVDSSRIRLFIKEGLYAEAPDFQTGKSDIIEGVTLNSKLLTVNKNAKFTLYIVDSSNNSSSVAFDITNISAAPVPTVVKVPVSHDSVRLYVLPPEGVPREDLTVLSPKNFEVDTDTESAYYLDKYIEISANDDYDIIYQIKYNGIDITDTLTDVSVTEISVDEIVLQGQSWSTNKLLEATANPVTVDLKFSHDVASINALTAYDASAVSFTVAGNTVRVTYTDNHFGITFAAVAQNGSYANVTLDRVSNIDKSAPTVELISDELAANGRYLTLVLATDERTSFKEGNGRIGDAVTDESGNTRYYYSIRITENGEYTYTFSDMSGIQTTFTYTASTLVLDELDVMYNTSPSEEGAVSDPSELELMTGDKVYVRPERNVLAEITTGADESDESMSMLGGEWYELTIPEAYAGIPPYITYTDEYGNVLTQQFTKFEVPDSTAPEIVISKITYAVRVGTERAVIETALLENMLAFDDKDAEVDIAVEFTANIGVTGITEVKYMATDSAGNVATVYGKLRITSIYEPEVSIDGKKVLRDEGVHLKSGEPVTFNIDTSGVNYKVILANGIKTAAQLKGAAPTVGNTTEGTLELGILDDGIYTIIIVTEQRDYFRILIAVENF